MAPHRDRSDRRNQRVYRALASRRQAVAKLPDHFGWDPVSCYLAMSNQMRAVEELAILACTSRHPPHTDGMFRALPRRPRLPCTASAFLMQSICHGPRYLSERCPVGNLPVNGVHQIKPAFEVLIRSSMREHVLGPIGIAAGVSFSTTGS
jgi:hypothetical protein